MLVLCANTQLTGFRGLGFQVRVTEEKGRRIREIKIVEGGCLEGRAIAHPYPVNRIQLVAQGRSAGHLAAVGIVIVMAQAALQIQRAKVQQSLTESGLVVPVGHIVLVAASDLVTQVFATQHKLMGPGREHILPIDGTGAGIENPVTDIIGKVFAFVLGLTDQHLGLPAIGEHYLTFQPSHLQRVVDISVVCRRAAFKFRIALGMKTEHTDFTTVAKAVADFGDAGGVVVAALFTVFAQLDAIGAEAIDTQAITGASLFTGNAGTGIHGAETACTKIQPAAIIASKELHHTAHRISTVQGTARATNHFYPLQHGRWQILPGRTPGGGGPQPHPVHQQQGRITGCPPHEDAGNLAERTITGGIHTGLATQNIGYVHRLLIAKLLLVYHRDRRQRRLRGSAHQDWGYHHRIQHGDLL